jgi:hypothetical protein
LQVWMTVALWGSLVVIAVLGLHSSAPPYFDVAGVVLLVPGLAYLLRRSATVSIEADERRVIIRNPYRTWVLMWDEIEIVEASTYTGFYGSRLPAILFRTSSGRSVKAVAVPSERYELEDVVRQLLALAPSHIAVRSEASR